MPADLLVFAVVTAVPILLVVLIVMARRSGTPGPDPTEDEPTSPAPGEHDVP